MEIIKKIKQNYFLIGILVLAAVLRLYHLDYQSIWIDEIITMKETDPGLSFKDSYEIMCVWENNPVMYYFLIKIIGIVFGHTTFVVRLVSALFGIFGVYLFYIIGKEIENKRVGLIAAFLASVNYFFILYSQEARLYIMLIFLTIFSFYRLIRFLKENTLTNALIYGVSLALMINSHFFGLFLLVSQVVILFVFLFEIEKKERKKYIIHSATAGVLAISIWYYFCWELFKIASEIKTFWIPPPSTEVITGIFKEFFGNSEALVFLTTILTIFYFIKLFTKRHKSVNIRSNSSLFAFIILICWILVTIFIPYIRSYLKLPMLTSRYLIVVLPAIILLLAISIENIKNSLVKNIILFLFVTASITDLFIVKKNYTEIRKTQFREITNKIKTKNKGKDKIVSSWGWHLSYFFNTDPKKDIVILKSLEEFINEIKSTNSRDSFWYVDGHFKPYSLSAEAETYLNNNFILVDNLEYYDTWARYYVPKASEEDLIILNINEFEPLKSDNSINILLFSNSTTSSKLISLEPGNYRLAIKTRSIPEKPINGENAHLTITLSGRKIASYFLTEKEDTTNYFQFDISKKQDYKVEITFDNDLVLNDADRNALVFSVVIEKIKK
ncbi:glycosyltransferase family 39 protein [Flavobacterium sp. J27]|uniref:glycosyltransferase family 39 protein n=1 Tax=Flavobacterium sp. J27 TaxID=2060419 RepID=UPI00102F443A|nr:glycosyltransferase family 39 protein [Flavobacterium sp. J27]